MAKMYLNGETLPGFKDRIEELKPDSERQFGSLDVAGMMRHMRNVMEAALEEVSYPDQSKPVVRRLMFFFATQIMTTWPKGRIKAPDFWTPPAEEDFERERELWVASLERFAEKAKKESSRVVQNPFFGPLKLRQWSLLNGIHVDHHLKQFGV